VDVDGVRRLAVARKDVQIILIGPVPQRAYLGSLVGLKNVHVRSEVRREEVVAVLRNAELTLLAHRQTALTEAMSPLKVYEYLAAGRPVLATDLGPVRHFGSRVHLAATVADFADLVDAALAQGIQNESDRVSFIEDNAWSTRHREIFSLLEK
jgi:glycosyltransferase involved in cell wall biosynthesis